MDLNENVGWLMRLSKKERELLKSYRKQFSKLKNKCECIECPLNVAEGDSEIMTTEKTECNHELWQKELSIRSDFPYRYCPKCGEKLDE